MNSMPEPFLPWLDSDLALLDEALRLRVIGLKDAIRGQKGTQIREQIRLAFTAGFHGDQAAAAVCITEAETLAAASPAVTAAPSSLKARTIIHRGLAGRVKVPAGPGPVLVGTDGSCEAHGDRAGWAYLATNGQWGCQAGEFPPAIADRASGDRHGVNSKSGAMSAELRAVFLALTAIEGPLTIMADSQGALSLLRAWKAGDVQRMPDWYSLRSRTSRNATPTLVRLAGLTAERGAEITFVHVKGHTGHLLNEAADALAELARRWYRLGGRLGQDVMTARCADIASPFLTSWRQAIRMDGPAG